MPNVYAGGINVSTARAVSKCRFYPALAVGLLPVLCGRKGIGVDRELAVSSQQLEAACPMFMRVVSTYQRLAQFSKWRLYPALALGFLPVLCGRKGVSVDRELAARS